MERQKYNFGCEQICVPLTRGKFSTIDLSDAILVGLYKWSARKSLRDRTWYAYGYRKDTPPPKSKVKRTAMHRLISGAASNEVVDHPNGNGLINRRNNLRICTQKQNVLNKIRPVALTGFRGVARHVTGMGARYEAKIAKDRRTHCIGRFGTAEEAARARDEFARRLFGEFGTYNFPRPGERSALTGEIIPLDQKVSA